MPAPARLLWGVCMLLLVQAWVGGCTPSPSGRFLAWCGYKYGSSRYGGVTQLARNLEVVREMRRTFKAKKLDTDWKPLQAQWTSSFLKLEKLGGVFKVQGRGLEEFRQAPSQHVKAALTKVVQVLQHELLEVATKKGIALDWALLGCGWNWCQSGGDKHKDICLPFSKGKLCKNRKKRPRGQHADIFFKEGYLVLRCGFGKRVRVVGGRRRVVNMAVYEYAHRLVCFAYRGMPKDAQHKVVSHTCHNKCCLNPMHLRWRDVKGNLLEGQQVLPESDESDEAQDDAEAEGQ